MPISNIINDSFGLISEQLKFYCWHYKRDLDRRQRHELIQILNDHHFERLANKIESLLQSNISDCSQQLGKLLFQQCLVGHRRHQLVQLIQSRLVDIDVPLDNYGRTLLHRMAYYLDVELVKVLIEHGVNIRLRDYAGNTALHIAIQSYRNGALIYNNGPDVIENLKSIIRLLIEADKKLQDNRTKSKKFKFDDENRLESKQALLLENSLDNDRLDGKLYHVDSNNNNSQTLNHNCQAERSHRQSLQISSRPKNSTLNNPTSIDKQYLPENNNDDITVNKQAIVPSSESQPWPMLMDDPSCPLVETRNAYGRTALHYCVLVVGEQYLDHIVELLISYGANSDVVDNRLKTPLYHLVKRPIVSAIRQKCLAMAHLLNDGCDDLGLAIEPKSHFSEELLINLEKNLSSIIQAKSDCSTDPILTQTKFKRVASLKHLTRLALVRLNPEQYNKLSHQAMFKLPQATPHCLTHYINKKILDQSEFF